VLYGLTQGADSMSASLAAEKKTLATEFDITADTFDFVDGSGGGESAATPQTIVSFLRSMHKEPFFDAYRDCLPVLATDGSLAFVTDFTKDASLAGAKGNVRAKTGTFLMGSDDGVISLRAQTFAGYITAKSGRKLAYALFVNDVSPVSGIEDVIHVFQDEGTISAIIWREN
jgi:D-alanyl-D-alanine carboxypeptidase